MKAKHFSKFTIIASLLFLFNFDVYAQSTTYGFVQKGDTIKKETDTCKVILNPKDPGFFISYIDINLNASNPPVAVIKTKDYCGNDIYLKPQSSLQPGAPITFIVPRELVGGDRFKFTFLDIANKEIPSLQGARRNIRIKTANYLTRFDFLFEEDFLLELMGLKSQNKDRNYTGGFSFVFSGRYADKVWGIANFHRGLDKIVFGGCINNCCPSKYNFNNPLSNMKLGGSAFSPVGDSLKVLSPVIGDRPYASLVYLSHAQMYLSQSEKSTIGSELVFGVLGLNVFRELQTGIHRWNKKNFSLKQGEPDSLNLIKPYYPLGWHNQVSNGGEFTALYAVTGRQLLFERPNHKVLGANLFDVV